MFKKKGLQSALIILAIAAASAACAQEKRKASLLISYMDKGSNIGKVQHVERVDFIDGEIVSRKRLVTLNLETDGYAEGVVNNRYLVTVDRNKTFDLQAGRFIHSPSSKLKESEKAKLPGLVSPDGTKSIVVGEMFGGRAENIEILFLGKAPVGVRGDFQVTVKEISSTLPRLPLLWIDNDRILTQRSNGNLVIISTDGTVSPFLNLPCTSEDFPALERNRSGKIVYTCKSEPYFLDVENRRYEKIKRDLGNGFSLDFINKDEVYYFKENEIGRDGIDAVTAKSYLAMLYGEAKDGFIDAASIKTIKVWNETKQTWTKITVDGWGATIVGWIEN
jgi:hypothetical protein